MAILKVLYLPSYSKDWPKLNYQYVTDAGFDLRAAGDYIINHGEITPIKTGLCFGIMDGYHLEIRPRSGLVKKMGITVANSPGTVDADYTGEVLVLMTTLTSGVKKINKGERIAQAVLIKHSTAMFEEVNNTESLKPESKRTDKGFGSTGKA